MSDLNAQPAVLEAAALPVVLTAREPRRSRTDTSAFGGPCCIPFLLEARFVSPVGLEPTAFGLRIRRSAFELRTQTGTARLEELGHVGTLLPVLRNPTGLGVAPERRPASARKHYVVDVC